MDFNLNFHPLDNLIKDKTSFWLEALVPFIDYKYKKYLIFYIKYKELTAILAALEDFNHVESCGFNCKAHSMDDLINGLSGFMPQDFSDNILQMKQMMDMMKVMNQMDNAANPGGHNRSGMGGNGGNHNHFDNRQGNDEDMFQSIMTILDKE